MECHWCNSVDRFKGVRCNIKLPVICRDCGTEIGEIDFEEFNRIINERDYYKRKFYEHHLTKIKK